MVERGSDREAQANAPKEGLSSVGDPTLFGTGSRDAGELGVEENTNIITMGWHMVLEFSPSLVACCISSANHSFEMIRRSQECVINVPTTDLVNKVIVIGNCSGAEMDKFKAFGLTPALYY